MKRKSLVMTVCLFLLMGTAGLAGHAGAAPYSKGAFYLTPMAGGIFYLDEPDVDDGMIVGGRIGYFFSERISVEGDFDYAFSEFNGPPPAEAYDGLNANHYFGLLNGLYHFKPVLSESLRPYLLAGVGGGHLDTGRFSETGFAGNYGAGLQYVLSDIVALRGEVRHLLMTDPSESNVIVSLGLAMTFGGEEPAAPAPPPPPAAPADSDGDGVVDASDACPDTPRGCVVDERGCHLDSDGDGVCDGVDQCPDTPKGCIVDARGCPLDGDGDGVCDGIDQCPDTPKGAKVDEKGCSFRGGVLEGINFEFDKATILPDSYPVLDDAALFLKSNPNTVVEIGGHTDSKGKAAYNQKLSERRAEAVRQYLISKGVPASQMTSKGYGLTKPIADNATDAGRAKNRRIEFTILSQ
ncbi:MAG: OmpA family protein [bacterium]